MADQNYSVSYTIDVQATEGVRQLQSFTQSVEALSKFKGDMGDVVSNINNTMQQIDAAFKKQGKNGKDRELNYKFNIETKTTEARLKRVLSKLGEIEKKSKGIKLVINPGKALNPKTAQTNAKQIVDTTNKVLRSLSGSTHQTQTTLTRSIGKINSALRHLERGREINIKTETAKQRLQQILGLLRQIRSASGKAMTLGMAAGKGAVNATRVPFAPSSAFMLPPEAAARLAHAQVRRTTTAARKTVTTTEKQVAAEQRRIIARQQKEERDAAKNVQRQNIQAVRGLVRNSSQVNSQNNNRQRSAINRLQYSKAPSFRNALPFAYMLNGYMLYSGMKTELTKAVEYANTMESARNILRVADGDLSTFEHRFAAMARNVRQVGVETRYTSVEVAGAVKYLAMAGQSIDTINKSIRPITNLALIGDNDIAQIADLTTNIMAGYDIAAKSMPVVADIIASTISRSNVNIVEVAESFKMAAGTLRIAGIDFSESSAAIGLLGNAGMKGTMAGTSLRAIANRLAYQPKEAREILNRLGVNFTHTVDVYGQKKEQIRPLADIFEDLHKKGASLADLYKIFGRIGANGAMFFLQNYEKLRELSADNRTSHGISSSLALAKQETTKGLWYQMTSMLSESFMRGYEIIEPTIKMTLERFIANFNTEKFSRGLAALGGALLDLFTLLAKIGSWFTANFSWLGPLMFTGFVATKIFKLAGAVTNLGVALGLLGKKSAALSGINILSSLVGIGGIGGIGTGPLTFGNKRALVTAMRGAGVTGGPGSLTAALNGGMKGLVTRQAATGIFASQVMTGRGIVGAGASLGALGPIAIAAAGGFAILAGVIGAVAYKSWKMMETHRAVMNELEKKEKYSFPSIEALYTSLNKAYNEAKRTQNAVDELTSNAKLKDETGQPLGWLSPNYKKARRNSFLIGEGARGVEIYSTTDAYQDNMTEMLTTFARQQAVNIRRSFYGELGKQGDAIEAAAFVRTIPEYYKLDLNTVDTTLYASGTYQGVEWNSYKPETGLGNFRSGLANDITVAQGMKTGVYRNWINNNLLPELTARANEYKQILASQSYAEEALDKAGLDFQELQDLGLQRNSVTGQWEIKGLKANASEKEKEDHLVNSRLIRSDLATMVGYLRDYWGGSGQAAENIMKAAGFPTHLFVNEPERNELAPWNAPNVSVTGADDDQAGGNYSGTGKLSSAAPKQVIVTIGNLLSIETIELMSSPEGKLAVIQDLKEQMAEALISVVHDFDASWNS